MRRSHILAVGLALALVAWLASGQPAVQRLFAQAPPPEAPATTASGQERPVPRVRVAMSEARPIDRELVVYGRTEPDRDVVLRAETYGRVTELPADKGERVAAGAPLLRLDAGERAAMVAKAEALVRQRELEYRAAQQLGTRGFTAETQVAAAEANLEAARAERRARAVQLAYTTLEAPFDGLVVDRMVELGDYVDTGDPLARLMQETPFLVTGEVAETQRRLLEPGMTVQVELADGTRAEGELVFVAATAEEATRTYRIEVEIADGRGIPAGMSATLRLRFARVMAHRLSGALLTLDADHRLGVETVGDDDRVRFVPVELVRADAEAVWLAGLPERARVIVVGQGFVHAGDHVEPVPVAAEALPAMAGERAS